MTSHPLYMEAIRTLQRLRADAAGLRLREPAAITLATAGEAGGVSARTVLIKEIDARGLVFFTNLRSRKGRQLAANPRAALCAFWDPLMMQALIEGCVEPVADAEADAYWATRDRASQLGAWASRQSEALASRRALVAGVAEARRRFARRPVPRPPHWSGCRLAPDRVEFWRARRSRLNERVLYQRKGRSWTKTLLYP